MAGRVLRGGAKLRPSRDNRITFTFAGLDRNIASIKSKGRILIAWIDEAEPVTDVAWDILIPNAAGRGERLERRVVGDMEPQAQEGGGREAVQVRK